MSQGTNQEQQKALGVPDTITLTTEERIEFIAQLIVERIMEDELEDFVLLKQLKGSRGSS